MSAQLPRLRAAFVGVLVVIAAAGVCWLLVPDLYGWVSDVDAVRGYVAAHPVTSRLVLVGVNVMQVLLAFLPGEPVELAMGYAFGEVEGTVLCLVAAASGTLLIWGVVRRWGRDVIVRLFGEDDLRRFSWLSNERRVGWTMLVVFLIPGTPKDFLTYFAGLTSMRLGQVLLIATFGRLPSILTSTIAASAAGEGAWVEVAAVLGVALALALLGALVWHVWRGRSDPSA